MNTYGRINSQKLNASDMTLTCQTLKREVQGEINVENKRVNVDSAKKRAVVQHMDYEGFRQMVLGANLYQIKSKDLKDFSFGLNPFSSPIVNSSVLPVNQQFNSEQNEKDNLKVSMVNQLIFENQCVNFSQFKTKFNIIYKLPIDLTVCSQVDMLIKSQNSENIYKIFSQGFDIAYFVKMIQVFTFQLAQITDNQELHMQISFVVQLLSDLGKMKDIKFQVTSFLTKSERILLNDFIKALDKYSTEKPQEQEQQISELSKTYYEILQDVKNVYYK